MTFPILVILVMLKKPGIPWFSPFALQLSRPRRSSCASPTGSARRHLGAGTAGWVGLAGDVQSRDSELEVAPVMETPIYIYIYINASHLISFNQCHVYKQYATYTCACKLVDANHESCSKQAEVNFKFHASMHPNRSLKLSAQGAPHLPSKPSESNRL